MNYMENMILQRKDNPQVGIYSCCSANYWVLSAAMMRAKENHTVLLIESTANQVNQFGGYTGMKPSDFCQYIKECAREVDFPEENLILGGDHLGPLTWVDLPEETAMAYSEELVRQYVLAGYEKIHLDTSVRLNSDVNGLDDFTIASRGARLCAVAEQAWQERRRTVPEAPAPVYVIGSEVPIPGGMQESHTVSVTSKAACEKTLSVYKSVFLSSGLENAWERIVGLVVQPGVEFGNDTVCDYSSADAKELMTVLSQYPSLVFEGHSTDYQTREDLGNMVRDGIAILKVGPALTFMLREGLFALEAIEQELLRTTGIALSNFRAVLEESMLKDDTHWKNHCKGDARQQALERAFGFSDRARYYLPQKPVQCSIQRLFENLSTVDIPIFLLSQYLPDQYRKVRAGALPANAKALLLDHIGTVCDDYLFATGQAAICKMH